MSRLRLVSLLLLAIPRAYAAEEFPRELVQFTPYEKNPIFAGAGAGHWDVKIRERGWILKEGDRYRLWYTGYDGSRMGIKRLGLAESKDGIHFERSAGNPRLPELWVEDMMVVRHDGIYYMFAEGRGDRAQLLTSTDGENWTPKGTLDVREPDGKPIAPGPFGTPTAWFEDGRWRLFFERGDRGVWLATSRDMAVWTKVQEGPVLEPGQGVHDELLIALNQVVRHRGRYYAYYHGRGKGPNWSTCVAVSDDLVHWRKYRDNPILPLETNPSSGILVPDGSGFRLYTMHDQVRLHYSR